MGTFTFKKKITDVEDPVLLPEDWYDFEIYKEPEVKMNYKLSQEADENSTQEEIDALMEVNEKLGYNLVVNLETESPDDAYNGRKMKISLPYPSDVDEDRYDGIGQKLYDAKMKRLRQFAESFGGSFEDEDLSLSPKCKGAAYVEIAPAGTIPGRDEESNTINIFAGFKEYGVR